MDASLCLLIASCSALMYVPLSASPTRRWDGTLDVAVKRARPGTRPSQMAELVNEGLTYRALLHMQHIWIPHLFHFDVQEDGALLVLERAWGRHPNDSPGCSSPAQFTFAMVVR